MLLYPNTPKGTFLVRTREEINSYALSVRFFKYNELKKYKEPIVKHFMLRFNPTRREYELGGLVNRSFTVHRLEDLTRHLVTLYIFLFLIAQDLIARLSLPGSHELGVRLTGPVRAYRPPEKFA